MKCLLDLQNIELETRDDIVFFASHECIAYRDKFTIVLRSCDGTMISVVKLPGDHKKYECIDLDDSILLLFGGKHIVIFDKYEHTPIEYGFEVHRLGRIITKPLLLDENKIIVGTKLMDRIQFLIYDFMARSRVRQTASWNMSRINSLTLSHNKLYALLDNAYLVGINSDTGQTIWTRFETGRISDTILTYKKELLYTSQNILKRAKNKKVNNIRIPLVRIHNLEQIVGDKLYFTANKGKNICCYDLRDNKLIWEIYGNAVIQETILAKGIDNNKTHDVMLIRSQNALNIVNLTLGQTVKTLKIKDIARIRQTDNHILIHKYQQNTDMIAGVE